MARVRNSAPDPLFRDASEIVAGIADRVVTPAAVGATGFSVVGLVSEFVFTFGHERYRRWQIANDVAGRSQLDALISDVVEGRMVVRRGLFRRRGRYAPYR